MIIVGKFCRNKSYVFFFFKLLLNIFVVPCILLFILNF
uniref:Uncharacterized protein n=1 Tax=Rhizophora mucronata TaxID=61149 RepID=A0A2P2Q6X5_RHIMU